LYLTPSVEVGQLARNRIDFLSNLVIDALSCRVAVVASLNLLDKLFPLVYERVLGKEINNREFLKVNIAVFLGI